VAKPLTPEVLLSALAQLLTSAPPAADGCTEPDAPSLTDPAGCTEPDAPSLMHRA